MGEWRTIRWNNGAYSAAALAASMLLLMAPAIINGFPLVFPDTGAYLGIAYGKEWTIDRAGFYGLMLKPAALLSAQIGIWTVLVLQVAVIAAVLLYLCRTMVRGSGTTLHVIMIAALCATSSLPWHSAQLMPDAFTGPLVLLTFVAISRDPLEPGAPLLWLGVTFLTLVHWTHAGIVAGATLGALIAQALMGSSMRAVCRKVAAMTACLALASTAHLATNGLVFNRWSVAPMGPVFLYARLTEDGLVPRWLNSHCGRDAPRQLCEIRHAMPADSQIILWGGQASPLHVHIGSAAPDRERWAWVEMMDHAAWGSIREQPVAFAEKAVAGAVLQFVSFAPLDDECPDVCTSPSSALINRLQMYRPALVPVAQASLQLEGRLPKAMIRAITRPVAWSGLVLLIVVIVISFRRRDRDMLALSLALTFALLANSVLAGALSDVHDRYQSRLVWLVPLTVVIGWLRWRSAVQNDQYIAG